jgi:hypothetical protein
MMALSCPTYTDAPLKLLRMESNCGLVSARGVLKYFKKRTSSAKLIESCRYTKKHGTFTNALAVALRQRGLKVGCFSETERHRKALSLDCRRKRTLPSAGRKVRFAFVEDYSAQFSRRFI